ncbi:CGP-CTERM sorting domain-containing protein [Thermococcus sp.]|uniref:CGP-CTERM sorting domain-containing protein n=1 Tax=Thermococcus sp. TaxID=35749 RepID=UPI002620C052|nr:CGP-CTERM sorting domain-containing protein [Thermococcus sp.]
MRKLPLLLSIFLLAALIPAVGASPGYLHNPIYIWPMNENFSMIPLRAPNCYPLYFGLSPVEIDNGTYAVISGIAYTGCPNVSSPMVEILGVHSFNMTFNGVNRAFRSIKVAYYTPKPYRIALDLKTTNVTVTYRPYNSTYELVLVDLSNITLGLESSVLLKTSDPGVVGWPRELHLRFIVNKATGEGYLLENGEKKYLGLFPLLPAPYLSPERYVESILKRTREFISTVEANPWLVEGILNKVKVNENSTEVSKYLQAFALNATVQIMSSGGSYLGNPARIGHDYIGVNSNNTTVVLDFMSWVERPYNVATFTGGPMRVNRSEAKNALLAYLERGNPKPLKDLVLKNALRITSDPYLLYGLGGGFGIVDFHTPPTTGGILTLPLPSGFNGSYILIMPFKKGSEPFLHVNYDPSLYTPENFTKSWKVLSQCIPYLRSGILSEILNLLSNASTMKKFNASSFEALYPFVEGKLRQCGFNVTGVNASSPTSSSANISRSASSQSASMGESRTKGRNHRICGPAMLVGLSLIAAVFGRW